MKLESSEILINATRLTADMSAPIYEFIFNEDLIITQCVQVHSIAYHYVSSVPDYCSLLSNTLFELNHVRINPYIDNTAIISKLTDALANIGVTVKQIPHFNDMAQCYKPLGGIMDNVRFHFNESGHCVFLCPNAHLTLIKSPIAPVIRLKL